MKPNRILPFAILILALLLAAQAGANSPLRGKSRVAASANSPLTVPRYSIFEQTLTWPSSGYQNPWEQVAVTMTLTSPSNQQVTVGGFYYDANTWKARFAPAEIGDWSWQAVLSDGTNGTSASGSFTVVDSTWPGFVRQNPTNPYRWVFDNGAPYNPIGIGDCIASDLLGWGFDGEFRRPGDEQGWRTDIDTYMSAYSGAGVNLFRWSVNNCAFNLYQTIATTGNVYLVPEGQAGDQLVQKLRQHGFRTYMTIFGSPPFPQSPTPQQLAAIERYVKYVVDRYGAYIDFWELMNESDVSADWYTQVATYLRSRDPYQHRISTSNPQPALSVIDINSPHWYQREDEFTSDSVTWDNFAGWKAHGKPTIVGEQGNSVQNWDDRSALRMRLRSWTAFFAEGVFIFWNTSFAKDYHNSGAANIYLGPEERGYLRVLQDFTRDFDPQAVTTTLTVSRPDLVRGYALTSPTTYAAYLHSYTNHSTPTSGVSVTVAPQAAGTATWLSPATGQVLATLQVAAGTQQLTVPDFITDVALKISNLPPPSPTPTSCALPFVDIAGNVFYRAIQQLYCQGVVNGTDATHFSPSGTSTRGQFAKVVVLGFGLPLSTPTGGTQSFSDVPPSYFAYAYIETGYQQGILSGFDQATCQSSGATFPCYLPNRAITRGQLTKLVAGAAHYILVTPGTPSFSDVPPSNVFFAYIETARQHEAVGGYPDGTFRPNNNIRRDEMAQIVYRAVQR